MWLLNAEMHWDQKYWGICNLQLSSLTGPLPLVTVEASPQLSELQDPLAGW